MEAKEFAKRLNKTIDELFELYKKGKIYIDVTELNGKNSYYAPWKETLVDEKELFETLSDEERRFLEKDLKFASLKELLNIITNQTHIYKIENTGNDPEIGTYHFTCEFGYQNDYGIMVPIFRMKGKRNFRKQEKVEKQNILFEDFENSCKELYKKLQEDVKEIRQKVRFLLAIRNYEKFLEENNINIDDAIEALKLKIAYVEADDKIKFLKENNFEGIENFGYSETEDDGFGHQNVYYTSIDFLNKKVSIGMGNSSD